MNLPALNRKTIPCRQNHPVRILQFGEGNFLRCFVDWMFNRMNNEAEFNSSVTVVQPLEKGNIDSLNRQDGLYTVYLKGLQDGSPVVRKELVTVIDNCLNPYSDFDGFLQIADTETLRFIVSNTTEAGIEFSDKDRPGDRPQKTYPGKLAAFLYRRYMKFNGAKDKGLIILPCELIDNNGDNLRECVLKYADLWNLDPRFKAWLTDSNLFANTLVDRIVPGFPKGSFEEKTRELGYIDNCIVEGEIFHLWVIEDKTGKIRSELPSKKAGLNVLFVPDVTPYKKRKVAILNGAHTAMTPVSYLYGIDTVRETVEHPVLGKFVHDVIYKEIVPTINLKREEMLHFASDTISRFKNPFIRHQLMDISLNSTTKYKTRNLPSVTGYIELNKGRLPDRLLFSLAALIAFYRGKRDDGTSYQTKDNPEFLEMYGKLWNGFDGSMESARKIAIHVLGLKSHWETDLNSIPGLTDKVADYLFDIVSKGMKKTLDQLTMNSDS